MNAANDPSQSLHDAIHQILLKDWDPIGVQEWPETQDEYDSYIGGVYRLLAAGATEQQIVDHLDRIESQKMLLPRDDKSTLIPVARKLRALDVQIKVKQS